MITPSDKEYKATKRIKQGKTKLSPLFNKLATWIGSRWNVAVLNVVYDGANNLHAPRLQVILEHQEEVQKFHDGFNFDSKKQNAIATKFLELINSKETQGYDIDGLLVVFSAFSPIAKEEADSQLSEEQIRVLKTQIANPDLWVISRRFGHVTFMFYTYEQATLHEVNGYKEVYGRMYFDILKVYDEFGYLNKNDFSVNFDSKQNFDDNYKSNWYYYYK